MNNYNCWLAFFDDGKMAEVKVQRNAHEALFIAGEKTSRYPCEPGRFSQMNAMFKSLWFGQTHRRLRQMSEEFVEAK